MTKIRKQKRKKRFRANVNRKRLRNKLRKLPTIECEEIAKSWELKKSMRSNLTEMGLAYDPNEVLKIPSRKKSLKVIKLIKNVEEDDSDDDEEKPVAKKEDSEKKKIYVANKLEADAKAPRERSFRLPKNQVQFVTYMMDKYGDDYKAMARDRKNYYQMTWCQIRAKINTFKNIPEQYAEYLLKSGEIVLDDPTPLEETKKKIGEENLKKYCVAKNPRVLKKRKPLWEVEDVNEFHENDDHVKDDLTDSDKVQSENGVKKLKLFSDDESDADESTKNKNNRSDKHPIELKQKDGGAKTNEKKKLKDQKTKVDKNLNKTKDRSSDLMVRNIRKEKKSMSVNEKFDDSDDDDEASLEGNSDSEGFVGLSDLSDGEISQDDLNDAEFVTDSDDSD